MNPQPVRDFLSWLIAMDDPSDPAGIEARRTVTLTRIIDRARALVDAPPPATPLNRHEAAGVAAAAIHSYASRADDLSYDDMGAAAVDALVHLGVLQVLDLDHVSAGRREREEHHALDRDRCTCAVSSTQIPDATLLLLDRGCPVHTCTDYYRGGGAA